MLLVLALVPPVSTWARRYDFVEAIQFCVLAIAVPAFYVLGAPFSGLRIASSLGDGRQRHPEAIRSLGFLLLAVGVNVAWRTVPAVDALARNRWLVVVEAVTLVAAGIGLWLELVPSPPLSPRATRPMRILIGAVAMWALWVTAYAVGLSGAQVYTAFHHTPGSISVAADQELATAMIWFLALCAFVPVLFYNLARFMHEGERPEDELRRLVRFEARRSAWTPSNRPPRRPPSS